MSQANYSNEHIALMCTDIEGSTSFLQKDERAYIPAYRRHFDMIRALLRDFGGEDINNTGDGLLIRFPEVLLAVQFAAHLQECFAGEKWDTLRPGERVRIRIGIHIGEIWSGDGNYVGLTVNRTCRICSAAHGGQILFSEEAQQELIATLPVGYEMLPLGMYRLRGLDSPEHLYQLTTPMLKETFPPLRALGIALPPERTPFIGRQELLERVETLLDAPDTRLVTLTGIGGMGKSRIALRIAHWMAQHCALGIYFAELAALTDMAEIPSHLLSVFGVVVTPDISPLKAISHFLSNQPTLLILDNLEHLPGVERLVLQLLDSCPNLRILATSRVSLPLQMQQEVMLPPLTLPGPGDSFATVGATESVQMFVRRAQNIDSMFQLTPENAPDVVDICRITAGIPLGIEHAALRIRLRTPKDIAARLQHQLLDVTARTPELPERLRSLRAAFEYSDKLLPPEPRVLLGKLLVFRGSFTPEAVEAVCAAEEWDGGEGSLETLLIHSWIERLDSGRFRLLEPVREYVREKAGEPSEALCEAHARYYLKLGQHLEWLFRSNKITEAFGQLRLELENFRAALRWACNVKAHAIVVPLASSLSVVMAAAGLWSEFDAWIGLAIHSATLLEDSKRLNQLTNAQGYMMERRGDFAAAYRCYVQALAHAEVADDTPCRIRAHINLANLARTLNRTAESVHHAQETIRLGEAEEGSFAALGYIFLAAITEQEGQEAEAELLWQKAYSMIELEEDVRSLACWANERGEVKEKLGDFATAMCFYHSALLHWCSLEDTQNMTRLMGHLASVALRRGNPKLCTFLLSAAGRLAPLSGSEFPILKEVTQLLQTQVKEDVLQEWLEEAITYSPETILAILRDAIEQAG